ncbi:TPA: dienelactone hydrolase family protein [Pseudomonas aeruginosa]
MPFYGRQAKPEEVLRIKAPLLLHFAETDPTVTAAWPAYEAALKAAGKTYEAHGNLDTSHSFHNDSTPRYDQTAAKLARDRTSLGPSAT